MKEPETMHSSSDNPPFLSGQGEPDPNASEKPTSGMSSMPSRVYEPLRLPSKPLPPLEPFSLPSEHVPQNQDAEENPTSVLLPLSREASSPPRFPAEPISLQRSSPSADHPQSERQPKGHVLFVLGLVVAVTLLIFLVEVGLYMYALHVSTK